MGLRVLRKRRKTGKRKRRRGLRIVTRSRVRRELERLF